MWFLKTYKDFSRVWARVNYIFWDCSIVKELKFQFVLTVESGILVNLQNNLTPESGR